MLISVKDLTVIRGGRAVLRGVGFELSREQALHVTGSNGSGKTSLLETLCGLREPECGSVQGLESAETFHWIGHKNALSPALTAAENLQFWCQINGASSDRVENAFDRLQLRSHQHRPCRELSIGQRRRAALARLLAVRRPLWLLDEPLSGLDAGGVNLFTEILRAHLALGGAAVITSHQNLPPLNGMSQLEL